MTHSACLDIDGTLVEDGLWGCLIEQLLEDGLGDAGLLRECQRAFTDPDLSGLGAVTSNMPTALRDMTNTAFLDAADRAWKRVELMPFTLELAALLERNGIPVILISGAPQVMAEKVGQLFGTREVYGCPITPGCIFGRVIGPPGWKASLTREILRLNGLDQKLALGMGNGHNDIGMLREVGWPIAFEPSERLLRQAVADGWQVTGRNDVIPYLQKVLGLR